MCPLTPEELHVATIKIVKLVQQQCFSAEFNSLNQNKPTDLKGKFIRLSPFIDDQGLIRVGGRLKRSQFEYNKMHPILLPRKHKFTELVFEHEHTRLCHSGPQHLLASIRETYWPLSGRGIARKTVHDCIRCFKFKPKAAEIIMGELPSDRVAPSPPFSVTGIDYAGPFSVKDRKGRGCKITKAYIALFICFTVKAIHVELVSDLTTECFIAALRRFSSRRGKPTKIYSDNGTTFVGAKNQLHQLGSFLNTNHAEIVNACTNDNINWLFIPAFSPHFGGLWEAGVKSVKSHLKRVIGDSVLTFEEFYTVLVQVEAIVNSRPLFALSSDPNDLNPITPAHFLIGRPFTAVPSPDLQHIKENGLSIYQKMQLLAQRIWRRWSQEYISQLQHRGKWRKNECRVNIGTLVLIKDKNLPPLNWLLGRITELHPGIDGIARVASIRTSKGIIKRAIANLCPLPLESEVSVRDDGI